MALPRLLHAPHRPPEGAAVEVLQRFEFIDLLREFFVVAGGVGVGGVQAPLPMYSFRCCPDPHLLHIEYSKNPLIAIQLKRA